jgi:hypothetical protein
MLTDVHPSCPAAEGSRRSRSPGGRRSPRGRPRSRRGARFVRRVVFVALTAVVRIPDTAMHHAPDPIVHVSVRPRDPADDGRVVGNCRSWLRCRCRSPALPRVPVHHADPLASQPESSRGGEARVARLVVLFLARMLTRQSWTNRRHLRPAIEMGNGRRRFSRLLSLSAPRPPLDPSHYGEDRGDQANWPAWMTEPQLGPCRLAACTAY